MPETHRTDWEQFDRVHEAFLDMENRLDLFDWEMEGFPVWERIRTGVYNTIMRQTEVLDQAHPELTKDTREFLKGGYLWSRNIFLKNPFLASNHDVLVWGHERRKRLQDGAWWEIYHDPLLESTDVDHLMVEQDYNLSHRRPARTDNLRYLDLIIYSSTVYRTLSIHHSKPEHETISKLGEYIERTFGVSIDIETRVYEKITDRRIYVPLYRRLLERVDPSVVLLVVSYGKESFIEACRLEGVPVVELQHGTIDRYHVGYSFPGDRTKRDAPDYLFTFGEYWGGAVSLPIPRKNVFDVGYCFLEREYERYSNSEKTNEIVFVSQGTIAETLSKLAVELADQLQDENRVVYKLHPGEQDRWREAYPWLLESDVQVVEESPPLYELQARASYQVGVYSTAVFEGLRFGLNTILVELPGIQYMSRFAEEHDVPVVSNAAELADALIEVDDQPIDWTDFFEPGPKGRFEVALEEVKTRA